MKILCNTAANSIIMAMRSNDRWYLMTDLDERGRATLFLGINGVDAPIMSSTDIRSRIGSLSEDKAMAYFNVLITESFRYL